MMQVLTNTQFWLSNSPRCRLVADAKAWLSRARNMAQTKVPLKKMRELLHAGVRLGAELPQVEQLRVEIRKREWEDNAKKASTGVHDLAHCNMSKSCILALCHWRMTLH